MPYSVEDEGMTTYWHLWPPNTSKRFETSNLICTLKGNGNNAWLVFGNLNKIVRRQEKRGGRDKPKRQMQAFKDVIDGFGLYDLGGL